jgi:hypothetical protein
LKFFFFFDVCANLGGKIDRVNMTS